MTTRCARCNGRDGHRLGPVLIYRTGNYHRSCREEILLGNLDSTVRLMTGGTSCVR